MKSSEFRKTWRRSLANILVELSNLQQTEEDWLSTSNPRSYAEDVCGYFDDLLCGESLEWTVEQGLLSPEEVTHLQPFHTAFKKLVNSLPNDNSYKDREIVNSASWRELAALADKARIAFETERVRE